MPAPDCATPSHDDRCCVCGRRPVGSYLISLRGEIVCARHELAGKCLACALPLDPRDPATRTIGPMLTTCNRCQTHAVDGRERVRALVPEVKTELAGLGIELRRRVRVTLGTPEDLASASSLRPGGTMPLGLTLMTLYGGRSARREPLEILILGGLPALLFGRIVAHEAMHAWLAQEGVSTLPEIEEEGLCELAAYEWLGLRRGRLSRGLRGAAERNPDPVYGDGFRLVHRAGGAGPIRLSAGRFTRRT